MFPQAAARNANSHYMLWFVVDRHHRQGYFFICGSLQALTSPGERDLFSRPQRNTNPAALIQSPFRFVA